MLFAPMRQSPKNGNLFQNSGREALQAQKLVYFRDQGLWGCIITTITYVLPQDTKSSKNDISVTISLQIRGHFHHL